MFPEDVITMQEPSILMEGKAISHAYSGKVILHNINLTVRNNEIVTIIGPNGTGKTTLARIILGLLKPDHGEVVLKKGVTIGYMPQKLAIDPVLPLTVERFLALRHRKKKPSTTMVIRSVAEEMGIGHILRHQLHAVSGGEMQRVLLARALLAEPDFLVMDEPVQGLDVQGQTDFYKLIEQIRNTRHCGILMISHDLHMVMATTDHVVCINHHICCEGSPEDVSKNPAYLSLFGLKAQNETVAIYKHTHDHTHDASGDVVGHEGHTH
jgi:zinc transport system ATP-binding protein